jgi:protein-L-isoaspartate(D-aspartate) O-methyltransferase
VKGFFLSLFAKIKRNRIGLSLLLFSIYMLLGGTLYTEQVHDTYEPARKKLAYNHLHDKGIKNKKVLDAIYTVKRHLFLPKSLWSRAYQDIPLPFGDGYYAIEPSLVALIADKLAITGEERILVIGTREGYLCAVLAQLAKAVYTIETEYTLYRQAEIGFYAQGIINIWMRLSADYYNWQQGTVFDCIVVNGSLPELPDKLLDLLKEGGVLIVPLGDRNGFQELILIKKKNGQTEQKVLATVMFPPL